MFLSAHLPPKRQRHRLSCSGWTMIELMVAVVAGTVILGSVVVTSLTITQTLASVGNYNDLDKYSRNTLDIMNRDLRGAAGLTNYTPASIMMTNLDGSSFKYAWDGSNVFKRVSWATTNTTVSVLLTNCDFLTFNIFQRNPTNGFDFVSATNAPNQTKLVSVSWRCSRSIFGMKINTESVQTARIALRN